jgi:hypothetical protein
MMLYCGPGPERMLRGVMAVATVCAKAGAIDRAVPAAAAATKIIFLNCMTGLLATGYLREDVFVTFTLLCCSAAESESGCREFPR